MAAQIRKARALLAALFPAVLATLAGLIRGHADARAPAAECHSPERTAALACARTREDGDGPDGHEPEPARVPTTLPQAIPPGRGWIDDQAAHWHSDDRWHWHAAQSAQVRNNALHDLLRNAAAQDELATPS